MQPNTIQFYETRGEYGCFSNFSKHPINLDGTTWPTTEHYFQAMKFAGTEHEEKVRNAPTAMAAAKMGRERSRPLRKDWEDVKEQVMMKALRAKFTQHANARNTLLGTGNARLVEHTDRDSYWADGGDGSGKNRLGELLMRLRAELRA